MQIRVRPPSFQAAKVNIPLHPPSKAGPPSTPPHRPKPSISGVVPDAVVRGGGGSLSPGSILPLRGTGDAASGLLAEKRHHRRCREPGNFAAQVLVGRRPGSWIAEWMDRRVVRELSLLLVTLPPPNFAPPSSPFNSLLERVVRCWHSNAYSSLFSSLFFFFHRTNFSRFRRTFHSFDPVGFAIFAISRRAATHFSIYFRTGTHASLTLDDEVKRT